MGFSSFLNKEGRFYTFSEGAGPVYSKTWTQNEKLDCALHQLSGGEQMVDYGKTKTATHRVFVITTSANVGEMVKIDNVMYEIVFKDDPMYKSHHVEMLVEMQTDAKLTDFPDI